MLATPSITIHHGRDDNSSPSNSLLHLFNGNMHIVPCLYHQAIIGLAAFKKKAAELLVGGAGGTFGQEGIAREGGGGGGVSVQDVKEIQVDLLPPFSSYPPLTHSLTHSNLPFLGQYYGF